MKELTTLLLCIIAVFVYINFIRKSLYLDKIESTVNGKEYYVRNLPDKVEAADKLATIGDSLSKLILSLDINDKEKGDGIKRLRDSFNSDYITENIPGSMYVAYSVNKGEELSICLRERETEKFINNNIILFVAIHELAHIMTKETGHPPVFWDNMKYLLEKASLVGIYHPQDYSKEPVMYCGMEINATPLDM
tara:strand:+ start:4303 stop:4881 length:579 start_codon:yes stop_codon:yes gene_type:complete